MHARELIWMSDLRPTSTPHHHHPLPHHATPTGTPFFAKRFDSKVSVLERGNCVMGGKNEAYIQIESAIMKEPYKSGMNRGFDDIGRRHSPI